MLRNLAASVQTVRKLQPDVTFEIWSLLFDRDGTSGIARPRSWGSSLRWASSSRRRLHHLRYAQHLAGGLGFTFNTGQRCSHNHTAFHRTPGWPQSAGNSTDCRRAAIGLVSDLIVIVLLFRLASQLSDAGLGLVPL